ncbi:PucR C-terminal helix-turn-helix domain-containing protein [Actinokineospora alba]|uniref:PucR C-terminal helix-turn-helix domain-containing protein n=1 Tax=Actinokineospora alba TaxID=504798 RepID=A0A1H0N9A0_9PSEU|nr:PucR family transcriptional regulator [Actinokineospora alba]TDP68630.1 PucR-like helix-turn-helix protein [Actinokineospora alba]SDH83204.1 PucR C-terminal helix-turn-helix domain-containing protein [Actinokineospora alba]SDO89267.1 PucR C-terminal helix-turn-helix domain-containing protein [Actinokineospora alba]
MPQGPREVSDLELSAGAEAVLRARLPSIAELTVAAIIVEVPSYTGALSGKMGANIERAVQLALGRFLDLASRTKGADPSTPMGPAVDAARDLGRGEARSGRSMEALLAAYRVGARVSWRELAAAALEGGLDAAALAQFAELVFAYIDELSAASVAGHADELATTGRVRQRHLERLSHALLTGAPADAVLAAAERAHWPPPRTLTAVLVPVDQLRKALTPLDARTLQPAEDVPGLEDEVGALLVPDAPRATLLRALRRTDAFVGPTREWLQVRTSYDRALRAWRLGLAGDTDAHLAELVVRADEGALEDLRARVLAPIRALRPTTAEKLTDTLRSWLLHHGRREDIAADLFVHAQTVRYRMGQLRELYGEKLDDPRTVLELTLALAAR